MKKKHPLTISNDEAVILHLRKDPKFASEYLRVAFEEATDEEGLWLLRHALRQVSEARGMQKVAKKAGIPRQSLYRALSPKGNPRLNTFMAVITANGLTLRPEISRPRA